MYMGVGKMYDTSARRLDAVRSLMLDARRFMQESRNSVENGLKTRSKEVEGELSTIVKRIKVRWQLSVLCRVPQADVCRCPAMRE